MSLRPKELSLVSAELNQKLVGAFVQKAWAPMRKRCYLELRQVGRSTLLLVSVERDVARISVSDARLSSEEPAPLQKWLRQELIGAQLEAAEAMGRIVRLRFRSREGERMLVADMAEDALILAGDEGRILAVSTEGAAKLAPGQNWELPETEAADESTSRLQPDESQPFPYASAAEKLHEATDRQRRLQEARRRLIQPLKTKRSRLARTVEKVRAEASRTKDAEEHRRFGELLAQNVFRIPKGHKSVKLTEYTEEGERNVEVPLDPSLPPKDQPERHFHQYRRLLRGAEFASKRLGDLEAELGSLDAELERLQSLEEAELLEQPLSPVAPAVRREEARHTAYRTFLAKSGARILVGKSSQDNDVLTFKLARPFDLWLHARGVPGSHVVVPLERGAEIPQETLLDAAHLALHYSPNKGEPRAEVAYTYAKFVRKMKDGPPGAVVYTREKVFMVRVEPGRTERLLATAQQ